MEARLAELSRRPDAWPIIGFASVERALSERPRDSDREAVPAQRPANRAILYSDDVSRLREVAQRLGRSDAQFKELLGRTISLVVATFGVPLHHVGVDDLDGLAQFMAETPRLTKLMRRSCRSRLFELRQLLFEAGMLDMPPPRRIEGDLRLGPSD